LTIKKEFVQNSFIGLLVNLDFKIR